MSSLDEIKTIVEIGTWNGGGSSMLIAKGVASNLSKIQDTVVLGLEANGQMYKKAKNRIRKYQFYKVVHGHIVEVDELDSSNLTQSEVNWFEEDSQFIKNSPNVLSMLPESIDLLLLDGGEFSTYAEFKKLEKRLCKFLILDDTQTRKSSHILKYTKNSQQFRTIFESQERNGVAVIQKIPLT